MNNNYYNYNFNPNQAFIRSTPPLPPNIMQRAFPLMGRQTTAAMPRISSLFSQIGVPKATAALKTATAPKLTFTSILSGTSKTLGVINQAIPVFYQAKPIWNNAKTMLRVVKELNTKEQPPKNINLNIKTNDIKQEIKKEENTTEAKIQEKKEDNSPTFFI